MTQVFVYIILGLQSYRDRILTIRRHHSSSPRSNVTSFIEQTTSHKRHDGKSMSIKLSHSSRLDLNFHQRHRGSEHLDSLRGLGTRLDLHRVAVYTISVLAASLLNVLRSRLDLINLCCCSLSLVSASSLCVGSEQARPILTEAVQTVTRSSCARALLKLQELNSSGPVKMFLDLGKLRVRRLGSDASPGTLSS